MTESELQARVEDLEIRIAHQDVALEELTRSLLAQERQLREQADTIQRLERQVRAALPSLVASRDEETPPPHY